MRVNFLRDGNGVAIPVLSPLPTPTVLAIGDSSDSDELPAGHQGIVEIGATQPLHFAFGGATVVATTASSTLPAGVFQYKVPAGATHIAVIQASDADGVCTVTALV